MNIILFVLAAVLFALDGLRVQGPVNFTPMGFCLLTVALFIL